MKMTLAIMPLNSRHPFSKASYWNGFLLHLKGSSLLCTGDAHGVERSTIGLSPEIEYWVLPFLRHSCHPVSLR
jgi:hypothetical protein